MQDILDDYIAAHISPEPEKLNEIYRHTNLYCLYPRMCSGHVQGRLLKMLTSMINPLRVLELGAFTGYSTLCMAEAMQPGSEIVTVEIDDEREDGLKNAFAGSPVDIKLIIGDALDIIPTLDPVFDMVFIDANKRHYTEYFKLVLPLVRPGGYILADNTLWGGKVVENPIPSDAQTQGILEFNDYVASVEGVEVSIIPVRDGLTVIKKL